ncbi:MAG: hypothetical protein SWE60_19615 [Thermodesulfobacteriota bacterium]|nr:hypothetical protein [Thermodesulfobacteriota bacterium]
MVVFTLSGEIRREAPVKNIAEYQTTAAIVWCLVGTWWGADKQFHGLIEPGMGTLASLGHVTLSFFVAGADASFEPHGYPRKRRIIA